MDCYFCCDKPSPYPCEECGGTGKLHCCEGEVAQPWLNPDEVDPSLTGGSVLRVDNDSTNPEE